MLTVAAAWAEAPENWQVWFSERGSEAASRIAGLYTHVLTIGGAIVLIVVLLIGFVLMRFRETRNPVASRIARAPLLEFAWTVLPIAILGAIAAPSLALLAYENRPPQAGMTIKAMGHQWFWRYEYIDAGGDGLTFDSLIIPQEALRPGQQRLLEVDNRLVLPVGVDVKIQTTSDDVVHSFFVPSLGVQMYAVPGRLNETWTRIDKPGLYYGQCNQICGLNHSFMPIAIQAMTPADFQAWLVEAKKRFFVTEAPENKPVTRVAEVSP